MGQMKQFLKTKSIRNILLLAILIRLLVMPFYFHPDIKTYHFQTSFLKKGVVDIYSYLIENKEKLPLKDEFVYFPLTYFSLGGYQASISPLLGEGFTSWVSDASQQVYGEIGTYRYLFLLKLPYLVLDILVAFLLTRFFHNEKLKKKVFILWLFNPFTIALIYIFSNIDIIPVALTLLSLFYARQQNKLVKSAAILGIAAGFKLYPLLLLPFLVLSAKDFKQKALVLLTPLIFLTMLVLPFWSTGFQKSAFVSGLTTRIFYPGISLGFGEAIIPAAVFLSALFFFALLVDQKKDLLKYYISLFLIIFSFSHFHIQWLLWLAPFLVILIVSNKRFVFTASLLTVFAFSLPFLYEDKSMTVSLFRVYSDLYNLVPIPFNIVRRFYDSYSLQSIIHSLFAGGSLVLIWKMFKKDKV